MKERQIVTLDDVRRRVGEIADSAHDDEVAHWKEDKLFYDVLYTIASGRRGGKLLAAEALKSLDLWFERWYA